MKFASTTQAAPLSNPKLYYVFGLGYAAFVTVIVTAQLFYFDKLVDMSIEHSMFGGRLGILFLTIVVTMGVFSLPYLLRLPLSPALRIVSWACAYALPIVWAILIWKLLKMNVFDMGLLGTISLGTGIGGIVIATLALFLAFPAIYFTGDPKSKNLRKHR